MPCRVMLTYRSAKEISPKAGETVKAAITKRRHHTLLLEFYIK